MLKFNPILGPLWNVTRGNWRSTPTFNMYLKYRPSSWLNYRQLMYGQCRLRNWNFKLNNLKNPFRWLSFYTFIHATTTERAKCVRADEKNGKIDIDTLIFEADDLFDQYKYCEVVELLQPVKDCDNVDVLWRLCKALYYSSKEAGTGAGRRAELVAEAYAVIRRALDLDDANSAVHKWYSVMLDSYAETQGFRARLKEIVNVKNHMLRAIELNPTDATTLYMLGSWCFGVSDLPWYQRKIVITLFGSFPTSSFEEALGYFKRAEETKPLFYSLNLLMLGKTYVKLRDYEEARRYLTLASTYPARSDEDQQANKEAADLLKQLPS